MKSVRGLDSGDDKALFVALPLKMIVLDTKLEANTPSVPEACALRTRTGR